MMRSLIISLIALCAIPALAQTGANCDIVSTKTVQNGDTLSNITTAANVTLEQVLFVNTQITNANSIKAGDVIKIPDKRCVVPAAKPPPEVTATCSNGTDKTYKVVAGDTLTIIATQKLNITLAALLTVNCQITNPDAIEVGDVVNIPLCKDKKGKPKAGRAARTARAMRSRDLAAKDVNTQSTPPTSLQGALENANVAKTETRRDAGNRDT